MTRLRAATLMLALALASAAPAPAAAQRSTIPPIVVTDVAMCVEAKMQDVLREGVYTPEIAGGWQIVVPLAGQPNANRQVQSPPPAQDADFTLDVFAVGSEAELPGDLDPYSGFAFVAADGIVWYARAGGYPWLRPLTTSSECFKQVTSGRQVRP